VVGSIFDNLTRIDREGATVPLGEQNVLRALRVCHRARVLENGTLALGGAREGRRADEGIKKAYLGR
jgi:branched-chain amino acid transport system ATP-binding protein